MKRLFLLTAALAGMTLTTRAGVHFDIGIGIPLPRLPVIVSRPAPVVVAPQVYPSPVVVDPCPPPVVYSYPRYWHRDEHRYVYGTYSHGYRRDRDDDRRYRRGDDHHRRY